jgi:hypothetical protein
LEVDPTQPKFLLTESGVGYRLKVWENIAFDINRRNGFVYHQRGT